MMALESVGFRAEELEKGRLDDELKGKQGFGRERGSVLDQKRFDGEM